MIVESICWGALYINELESRWQSQRDVARFTSGSISGEIWNLRTSSFRFSRFGIGHRTVRRLSKCASRNGQQSQITSDCANDSNCILITRHLCLCALYLSPHPCLPYRPLPISQRRPTSLLRKNIHSLHHLLPNILLSSIHRQSDDWRLRVVPAKQIFK